MAEQVLDACRNPDSEYRLRTDPGPFVFVKTGQAKQGEAVFVPEMLLLPEAATRPAAATYLSASVSSSTASLLAESRASLESQSSAVWVPAGLLVSDAIEKDFTLHHAGVRQCRRISYDAGQERCWPSALVPSIASLLSITEDIRICMACSTNVSAPAERPFRWVWDTPLINAVRNLNGGLPETVRLPNMAEGVAFLETYAPQPAITEMLDALPNLEAPLASFAASRLCALCRNSRDASNHLIEKLRDLTWRDACWTKLPEPACVYLGRAILAAQQMATDEATVYLPHVLAEAAISNASGERRAGLFVDLLVRTSIARSTTAALKALLSHPGPPFLRKMLLAARDNLLALGHRSPPVVRARLACVIATLSGH